MSSPNIGIGKNLSLSQPFHIAGSNPTYRNFDFQRFAKMEIKLNYTLTAKVEGQDQIIVSYMDGKLIENDRNFFFRDRPGQQFQVGQNLLDIIFPNGKNYPEKQYLLRVGFTYPPYATGQHEGSGYIGSDYSEIRHDIDVIGGTLVIKATCVDPKSFL